MSDPAPFRSGPYSMDSIASEAPDLYAAIERSHEETGTFSRVEDFVDCERFWDAIRCMEKFGVDVSTVHAGSVLCRECGLPVGSMDDHTGEHGMSVAEYRERYPTAPVNPQERALLPPADIVWRR